MKITVTQGRSRLGGCPRFFLEVNGLRVASGTEAEVERDRALIEAVGLEKWASGPTAEVIAYYRGRLGFEEAAASLLEVETG